MNLLALLAATLALTASPVAAQAGASVTQGPVTAADAAPKRICRRLVPTASIVAKKICLTAAEWRRFDGINQDDADSTLRRRGTGACDVGPGGCLPGAR